MKCLHVQSRIFSSTVVIIVTLGPGSEKGEGEGVGGLRVMNDSIYIFLTSNRYWMAESSFLKEQSRIHRNHHNVSRARQHFTVLAWLNFMDPLHEISRWMSEKCE